MFKWIALIAGAVAVGYIGWCARSPKSRWMICSGQNATFLLDTETGHSWRSLMGVGKWEQVDVPEWIDRRAEAERTLARQQAEQERLSAEKAAKDKSEQEALLEQAVREIMESETPTAPKK